MKKLKYCTTIKNKDIENGSKRTYYEQNQGFSW
jgi:hypothetical protein